MVAEVFFHSDEGNFAWTDSLRPEFSHSKSSAMAENTGNIPEALECCTARVEDKKHC